MNIWEELSGKIEGEVQAEDYIRRIYATDASVYRELPKAVVFPKNNSDVQQIIKFANEQQLSLIPRAAGTSLAGQVVGDGLVLDISKHFHKIGELNKAEHSIWVQAGVVRDSLNQYLAPHQLLFGPETSTSNRCMIAGMVGNNSCGSRSLVYGSTRDHLLELKGFLSDGSPVHFKDLNKAEIEEKLRLDNLEGEIYRGVISLLKSEEDRKLILNNYPHPDIPRRNTGYALDLLCNSIAFGGDEPFNICKLIAGSEGTLALITDIKLNLVPTAPEHKGLVCLQFNSLHDCLLANTACLQFEPLACELIDHYILECTIDHPTFKKYASFVEGKPAAVLVVEFAEKSAEALMQKHEALCEHLKKKGLGYAYPMLTGNQMNEVWELRKAGLGLLSNIPGDAKPVAVIEDTAVRAIDLPQYIQDFNAILKQHDLYCVHYAQAATGELHLRPILNLKEKEGREKFRIIAEEIAKLVKQYNGSLSGEHGDGRLRAEFIEFMIGSDAYAKNISVKQLFDPKNLLNPGKIVHAPKMDEDLRYDEGMQVPEIETALNFESTGGFIRSAEMCNGSADCKKPAEAGGTMCPSFMATREERDSTRARANILREMIGRGGEVKFDQQEVKEVLKFCLSCKACKSECPSNVDMAKLKAETDYQIIKESGASLQQKQFGFFAKNYKRATKFPRLFNWMIQLSITKKLSGIHPKRSLPQLAKKEFFKGFKNMHEAENCDVFLYVDEFTRYLEPEIAFDCLRLLEKLGYKVYVPLLEESGRSLISKGFLKHAKEVCNKNLNSLSKLAKKPIIGIEPSAILSFRDEYLDLADASLVEFSKALADRTFLLDEFLSAEIESGRLKRGQFKSGQQSTVYIHGHCHQKTLSNVGFTQTSLNLIPEIKIEKIPSGCCGMAGSFGFQSQNYFLSQQIGELVLFPKIRKIPTKKNIVASGTSCRHQIKEGTGVRSYHLASYLLRFSP